MNIAMDDYVLNEKEIFKHVLCIKIIDIPVYLPSKTSVKQKIFLMKVRIDVLVMKKQYLTLKVGESERHIGLF